LGLTRLVIIYTTSLGSCGSAFGGETSKSIQTQLDAQVVSTHDMSPPHTPTRGKSSEEQRNSNIQKYQLHRSEYVRDPSPNYCSQQWTLPSVCGRKPLNHTIDTHGWLKEGNPRNIQSRERERERDRHNTLTLEGLSSTYLV